MLKRSKLCLSSVSESRTGNLFARRFNISLNVNNNRIKLSSQLVEIIKQTNTCIVTQSEGMHNLYNGCATNLLTHSPFASSFFKEDIPLLVLTQAAADSDDDDELF